MKFFLLNPYPFTVSHETFAESEKKRKGANELSPFGENSKPKRIDLINFNCKKGHEKSLIFCLISHDKGFYVLNLILTNFLSIPHQLIFYAAPTNAHVESSRNGHERMIIDFLRLLSYIIT